MKCRKMFLMRRLLALSKTTGVCDFRNHEQKSGADRVSTDEFAAGNLGAISSNPALNGGQKSVRYRFASARR